ncbi:hypothetical protein GCWU000341_00006 [Oribacterium sp. oral taxon 078 str. F0262]|nr:hypothetical protein GCWU000341_00006 [Oribacterium sp. oral taxon 078 str. F0262]
MLQLQFITSIPVLPTTIEKQRIQLLHRVHTRDRHQDVSSCSSDQTFHQAFLVTLCRIAEDCIEPVMRRKSRIAGLLHSIGSESVFYGDFSVIEDHFRRCTVEFSEDTDERIQKAFFILAVVGQNNGTATVTEPGTEEMHFRPDIPKVYCGFAPVDLHCLAGIKDERQKGRGNEPL